MKVVEGDMTKNCLRKDLYWMLENCFSNRVIDNGMLSASCVNCYSTIKIFKKQISSELESAA